jgi:hypothetical protein
LRAIILFACISASFSLLKAVKSRTAVYFIPNVNLQYRLHTCFSPLVKMQLLLSERIVYLFS